MIAEFSFSHFPVTPSSSPYMAGSSYTLVEGFVFYRPLQEPLTVNRRSASIEATFELELRQFYRQSANQDDELLRGSDAFNNSANLETGS
jgi:hypothetical protein